MKILHRFKTKKLKAYSLLELLISLAIIAVATTVMINFLVISVRITVRSLARSFVREEISSSVLLIARDIRNSDRVINIDCPTTGSTTCEIRLTLNGEIYRWSKCADATTNRVCKDKYNNSTGNFDNVYTSSQNVNIDYMSIDYGYSLVNNNAEINILVTLQASHARPALEISNVIRQSSASTRNYTI